MPSITVMGTRSPRDDELRRKIRAAAEQIREPLLEETALTFVDSDTTLMGSNHNAPFVQVIGTPNIEQSKMIEIANLFVGIVDVELYFSQMAFKEKGGKFPYDLVV